LLDTHTYEHSITITVTVFDREGDVCITLSRVRIFSTTIFFYSTIEQHDPALKQLVAKSLFSFKKKKQPLAPRGKLY